MPQRVALPGARASGRLTRIAGVSPAGNSRLSRSATAGRQAAPNAALKDVILVAAVTFRGGRLVRGERHWTASRSCASCSTPPGIPAGFAELSERHGIPEAQLHEWRQIARTADARALADDDNA